LEKQVHHFLSSNTCNHVLTLYWGLAGQLEGSIVTYVRFDPNNDSDTETRPVIVQTRLTVTV